MKYKRNEESVLNAEEGEDKVCCSFRCGWQACQPSYRAPIPAKRSDVMHVSTFGSCGNLRKADPCIIHKSCVL